MSGTMKDERFKAMYGYITDAKLVVDVETYDKMPTGRGMFRHHTEIVDEVQSKLHKGGPFDELQKVGRILRERNADHEPDITEFDYTTAEMRMYSGRRFGGKSHTIKVNAHNYFAQADNAERQMAVVRGEITTIFSDTSVLDYLNEPVHLHGDILYEIGRKTIPKYDTIFPDDSDIKVTDAKTALARKKQLQARRNTAINKHRKRGGY